jgi:hypothetical protein
VGKSARPNFTEVRIGRVRLWFSYETPIALYTPDLGTVVRENEWGPTTGKHLNHIDGHSEGRVSGEEFQRKLDMVLSPYIIGELGLAS